MAVYAKYNEKKDRFLQFLLKLVVAGIFIGTLAAVIFGGMMLFADSTGARDKQDQKETAELKEKFYELTAANISYDWQHEVLEAVEDVRFKAREYRFEADWLKVYIEENLVLAGGDPVRVLAEGEEISGREISFNYLTGEGEFIQPQTRIDEITFSGNRLSTVSENGRIISLEEPLYTPCQLPEPHYSIRAEKVTIYPEDRVVAEGAAFYWGESKILGLPYYVLAFTEDPEDPENMILQDTGFLQEIGYDSSEGFILGLGYNYEAFGRIAGRLAYRRTTAGSEIREVENYLTINDNLKLEAGYRYRDFKDERKELYYAGWKYRPFPGLTVGQRLSLLEEWREELHNPSDNNSLGSTQPGSKQPGRKLAGSTQPDSKQPDSKQPGRKLAGILLPSNNSPGSELTVTAQTSSILPGDELAGTATGSNSKGSIPTGSNLPGLPGGELAGSALAGDGPVDNDLAGGDRQKLEASLPLTTYLEYDGSGRKSGRKIEIELEYDFLADSWRQEFFYREVFRKDSEEALATGQNPDGKLQKLAFSFYHDYRDWRLNRRDYLLELDYSGADWQLRYREGYDTDYLPYLNLELPLNNNLELAAGLGRLSRAERETDRIKISPSWQFSRKAWRGWDLAGGTRLSYIHHFSPEEAGNFAALEYEFQLERLFWRNFRDSNSFFRGLPERGLPEDLSLEQSGGLKIEAAHTRGSIYLIKDEEKEKIKPVWRLTPFSSITLTGADDFRAEIRGELEYDLLELNWRRTGVGLKLKLPGAGPNSFYVFDFQGDYFNRQGAWGELNFQLKRILDCYSFSLNYEAVDQVFFLGFDLNL